MVITKKSTKPFFLLILIIHSNLAYSYIDPASGAALVNILVALVGSVVYFLKNLIFKKRIEQSSNIGVFSEGRDYWGTFEPLLKNFIEKKVKINYYTFDIFDPALDLESEFIKTKYLGEGIFKTLRFNKINNPILLSTTPNIGSKDYTLTKPKQVKKLIHIFHSINDISMYKLGSLDFYDEVILAGPFQENSIVEIENKKKLKQKKLIPLGLPYLDNLVEEKKQKKQKNKEKTILIASSWGEKGCLKAYGIEFIKKITQLPFKVIIRPHPYSFTHERIFIENIINKLKVYPNISWDFEKSPSNALRKADILISDTSAIRFDFSFIYEKPVITLEIEQTEMPGFERELLDSIWSSEIEKKISTIINKSNIININQTILNTINEFRGDEIKKLKEKTITNFGKASPEITDYLINHAYISETS